ncbi:hypothetical protein DB346_24160 [Verrucomicrobia bacterium LW23]|nr:hypothetical protein DB346_24160 [Verrucomicrobia bacterium LW23]
MTVIGIFLLLLFLWAVLQPWVPSNFVSVAALFAICLFGTVYSEAQILLRISGHLQTYAYDETPARVISSTDGRVAGGGSAGGLSLAPAVTYSYQWGGREFTSDVIRKGGYGSLESAGEIIAFIAGLPAGAETRAYVNPRRPEEAVLLRGVPAVEYFLLFATLPLALFTVMSGAWVLRAWREKSHPTQTAGLTLRGTTEAATSGAFSLDMPPRQPLWADYCRFAAFASVPAIIVCGASMMFGPIEPSLIAKALIFTVVLAAGLTIWRATTYASGRYNMEFRPATTEPAAAGGDASGEGTLLVPTRARAAQRNVLPLTQCESIRVTVLERDPDAANAVRRKRARAIAEAAAGTSRPGKAAKGAAAAATARKTPTQYPPLGQDPEIPCNYRLEIVEKSAPGADDDERNRTLVAELEDRDSALRFADWLARRLGLRREGLT